MTGLEGAMTQEGVVASMEERIHLHHLGDVEVAAVVELGRKRMSLGAVGRLRPGDVIVLDKLAGERMTVRINGAPLAEGEIVVIGERTVCRLTRMAPVPGRSDDRPDDPRTAAVESA